MIEEWKDIEESKDYQISNFGNLRYKNSKALKTFGYVKHNTYKMYSIDGKGYLAHRLVAKYFVYNSNPKKYNIVNHLDENTHNNRADNLQWTTNKDNLNYSNVFCRNAINHSKFKVIQYDKNGEIIKEWISKEACYAAGFTQVKSFFAKKGFNRWAYNSFWFADYETFDNKRYKPKPILNIYNTANKLVFTGTTADCARFIKLTTISIIQGRLKRSKNKTFKILGYTLKQINYSLD